MNKPEVLSIHHTAVGGWQNQLNAVDNYHRIHFGDKSKLGFYVGYHWHITKFGHRTRTRLDEEEGVHTIGWNNKSIGICLDGDFNYEFPTAQQIAAVKDLIKEYKLPIRWHRELQDNRTCPGKNIIAHDIFYDTETADDEAKKRFEISKQLSSIAEVIAKIRATIMLLLK